MIVSWYRQKISDFGFWPATRTLVRIAWCRAWVVASNALLPKRIECPCCGWQGRRLLDYVDIGYTAKTVSCPRSDSHPRPRAFFLWLRDQYHIDQRTGTALIFAPERALKQIWETATQLEVFRTDIEPSRGVDVIGDLMQLPFVAEFAGLVWCHHVLEQVRDDRVALGELRRILRSATGELIISVAEDAGSPTREFGFSDKAVSGNRRAYGSDFPEKLRAAGFTVQRVNCDLSEAARRKYALTDEWFYLCRKEPG